MAKKEKKAKEAGELPAILKIITPGVALNIVITIIFLLGFFVIF